MGGVKEFQFTKLLKCGECGFGITATERIKRNLKGEIKKYIYYHCTRKDKKYCKQDHVKEEELLHQFVLLMDKINFNKASVYSKLKHEVEKYNQMSKTLFGINQVTNKEKEVNKTDIKTYVKYILKNGSIEEKREILKSVKNKFILKDRKILLN